ncbi:fructokinase-like 1, chloroplastic [Salvia miltiorrhiza]|uniref:fructokinase-like 1, chloroplastic n=1 Tax=Salvia miltiorrhiza TaxID=226208 RepID=UPI0025AC3A5D|nr:fructokinase-like 1, chloroplastic [Salvia miltiorrhiza]
MATLELLLHHSHSFALSQHPIINFSSFRPIYPKLPPIKSSATDSPSTSSTTPRRGRKKSTTTSTTKRSRLLRKSGDSPDTKNVDDELYDYDDGVDFPYLDPPLVCCFGDAQKEFVPTVRVAPEQMHPYIYSQWKMLQWNPPEFARAPGGPPSNVAISHVRLGGRAAFMGKVGNDEFGEELVLMMNKERVQTRGVKFDDKAAVGMSCCCCWDCRTGEREGGAGGRGSGAGAGGRRGWEAEGNRGGGPRGWNELN